MKLFFKILAIIFTIISIVFSFWLNIFSASVSLLLSIVMSAVLASIFRTFLKSWKIQSFKKIFLRFFLVLWGISGFFISIMLAFIGYQNVINPLNLPNITLQNDAGQKVVFVAMMHIAKGDFYSEKNASLKKLAENNFTILAEGVQSGSPESEEKLNKIMGFDFVNDGYEKFAKILALTPQSLDNTYGGIDENRLKSVEPSIDDIVNSVHSGATTELQDADIIAKDIEEFEKAFTMMTPNERKFTQNLMLAAMNFVFKYSDEIQEILAEQTGLQADFMRVILDERNKPVVEYIKNNPTENIAVVYGDLHFDGIFAGLKQHDASWKMVSTESFFPLK